MNQRQTKQQSRNCLSPSRRANILQNFFTHLSTVVLLICVLWCACLISLVRFSNLKGPAVRASNWSVSGTGTCVANAVLIQTRAYWEITILEKGTFWIGVTRKSKEGLEKHLGERPNSWGLFSGNGGDNYKVGDVISVSYDLSGIRAVLLFAVNGVPIDLKCDGIKGDVYPAVSVSDGAALQANFGATPYKHALPEGFSAIILSQDLI